MLQLAFRMMSHRISALVAVAVAVFGGAVLLTGTGVLAESGLRSHLPPGRLSGVDLVVSANQTFHPPEDLSLALPERGGVPAELAARLARVPGVTAAVADIGFPAALIDGQGRTVATSTPAEAGHGWASTGLARRPRVQGSAPRGDSQVAVDRATAAAAGLRPGAEAQVVAAGRTARYRVTAVVDGGPTGIFFADATAAHLAGRDAGPRAGTVTLIGVRTTASARSAVTAAVERQVGAGAGPAGNGLSVATGAARGDVADPEATAARSLLLVIAGSLAGIILLIVGFVVAGALSVSISAQRRELALLRAVGATPPQIRRLAITQAGLVAAAAALPGLALGYLLAGQFRRLLVDLGLIPDGLPLTLSPLPALAAVLLLALVVQISAWGAAWRTSRRSATEAVAESRSEPRTPSRLRARIGLLLILVATSLAVTPLTTRSAVGAAGTSIAGIVAAIGLALAGPALVQWASRALAGRLSARASAPTWLAVSNLHGYALRFAGAIGTLAMAVVFVLTYVLAQTTVMAATADDVQRASLAEHRIEAPGLGGLPTDLITAVKAVPGVRAAVPVSSTSVIWSFRQLGDETAEAAPAMILTPQAPQVLDLDVRDGRLADLTGATVAVGREVARSRDAGVGRTVNLVLGDGTTVRARVVAVYDRSLGFGPLVLSHDLAAGHTTTGLDQSLLVRADRGSAALAELVAARPGLTLDGGPADTDRLSATPPEVWINLAVVLVLLGYLLLSIANTLIAGTSQRRNEIAVLQLVGCTPGQIRAMLRREAVLIGVGALVTGLLLSAVPLALLGVGFLGHPWPAGPVWLVPVTVITVVVIAFGSIELPARQMLRQAPAHALSSRE